MARPKVIEQIDTEAVIPKLKKRTAWPVVMLAEVLGCGRATVYRLCESGDFGLDRNGIDTESVLEWLQKT